MKILLLQIDKTQEPYLETGIALYQKRLGNYARLEIHTISVPKAVRQRAVNEQKQIESELLHKKLEKGDFIVLLDEKGRQMTSAEFAKFISGRQNAAPKRLVFVVGGPYGFDPMMYEKADLKLSLSSMTFPHHLVRVFFLEQLYRAFTIIRGEKYHND